MFTMYSELDNISEFLFLAEATDAKSFVSIPFRLGGIPDLSGSAKEFEGMIPNKSKRIAPGDKSTFYIKTYPYDTAKANALKSYHYWAVILNDGGDENRTVVFVKAPTTFADERRQAKLQEYLANEYGYTSQIDSEKKVSPGLINKIGSRDCSFEEYQQVMMDREAMRSSSYGGTGEALANLAMKVHSGKAHPGIHGTREEMNAQIKAKANALAKEKMQVLIANGVSREDALGAAKIAYKNFITKIKQEVFGNKSDIASAKPNKAKIAIQSRYHPITSKTGEIIKAVKRADAKESAKQLYTRLIRQRVPQDKAQEQALDLYNRLMSQIS